MKKFHASSLIILLCVMLVCILSCNKEKPPVAKFTADKNNVLAPDTIQFTNLSENADSYAWDFGDSVTSTKDNPSHIYEKAGIYEVILIAKGAGGEAKVSSDIVLRLSLSGTWNKTFCFDNTEEPLLGVLEIRHQNSDKLEGEFVFTNGSGYTELGSNSVINDTNVTLVWVLQGMYELSFKGIINNDFDSMEGNFYTLDLKVGTWEATKLVN